MSGMGCRCGGVISTTTFPSPREGVILGQRAEQELMEAFRASVAEYLEAVRNGRGRQWVEARFGERYPHLTDAEMVGELLAVVMDDYVLDMMECDRCGRLQVQAAPGRNEYRSYDPDDPSYYGVLDQGHGEAVTKPTDRRSAAEE